MDENKKAPEFENTTVQIETSELLAKAIELKKQGRRLSQACAAYCEEKLELSYSFADDENFGLLTLRLVLDKETKVTSISEIFPYAAFYENEMKELFGVNIELIEPDYKNKLYRIREEAPFLK